MQNFIYLLTGLTLIAVEAADLKLKKLEKEIQALELERSDLFKKINKAIDESVKALQKSNDSDSLTGISYITDLRNQIKELNKTDDIDDVNYARGIEDDITNSDNETNEEDVNSRRALLNKRAGLQMSVHVDENKNTFDKKPFGMHTVFANPFATSQKKNRPSNNPKHQARLDNRQKVKAHVDAWIAKKKAEKKRIQEYREREQKDGRGKPEMCPRFGKGKMRRGKKKGGSKQSKFPCCRKCCKKSYMGCL